MYGCFCACNLTESNMNTTIDTLCLFYVPVWGDIGRERLGMKNVALILLASISLSGCLNEVPGCSDDEAQRLVLKILRDQMVSMYGEEATDQIQMSLIHIRTKDTNDRTGAHLCSASVALKGPSAEKQSDLDYSVEVTHDKRLFVSVF